MVLSETSNGQTSYYWSGLDLLAQSDGTNTNYLTYDGLGSVRQVTDSAGSVQYAQTFDPYGNLYTSSGTNPTKYAFTGAQQDINGLLFLRARYYNASNGRFFQTDPSRQENNPYQYGRDDPVLYTDPSGKCSFIADPILRDQCYRAAGIALQVAGLPQATDFLMSIGDPNRNPRAAAFNSAFWQGVNSWQYVSSANQTTASYSIMQALAGCWSNAGRGAWGLAQEGFALAQTYNEAWRQFGIGLITTPHRIFASDIPQFAASV